MSQPNNLQINSESDISRDVSVIGSISIVPLVLKIVAHITDMGFVAVARVTPQKWVACSVHDNINFGLLPGGELVLDTTICHEIRQSGTEVVIDDVSNDEYYRTHHTPAMYGFKSYISVPIKRGNGDFFGTLCAIDPNTALLSTPSIVEMVRSFAALISFHLDIAAQCSQARTDVLDSYSEGLLREHFAAFLEPRVINENEFSATENDTNSVVSIHTKNKTFSTGVKDAAGKIASILHELRRMEQVI